jgi:hypothetical protein
MSSTSNAGTSSVASFPIAWILTIVFVVLKLTHTIDWSWWWVLSPLWISAAFVIAILLLVAIIIVIAALLKD